MSVLEEAFRTYVVHTLAMKNLCSDQLVWNKFFIKLQQLISDYSKYIELRGIGFPENWIEILSKK